MFDQIHNKTCFCIKNYNINRSNNYVPLGSEEVFEIANGIEHWKEKKFKWKKSCGDEKTLRLEQVDLGQWTSTVQYCEIHVIAFFMQQIRPFFCKDLRILSKIHYRKDSIVKIACEFLQSTNQLISSYLENICFSIDCILQNICNSVNLKKSVNFENTNTNIQLI